MKNFFKTWFCLTICSVLFACTSNKPQETPNVALVSTHHPLPSETATIMDEISLLPTVSVPTFALPTVSFNTTPQTGFTPIGTPPTVSLDQMQWPYFEQAAIPGVLQSHLTIETLPNLNGYSVQRISGWKFGFGRLEWMDADHLLLYPFTGGDKMHPLGYPTVANLDSNTFWIPLPSRWAEDHYGRGSYPVLPRWSRQLGALIAAASDTSIALYSPDGVIKKVYEGNFLGISPSATKLLIDNTWIDLSSGKTVDFAWIPADSAADESGTSHMKPIWSSDEMRVYACCYRYGDARTGESLAAPGFGITIEGKEEKYNLVAFDGAWVLNDKYLLPIWGDIWGGRYSAVYLFDPAKKVYRNLSALADVTYEWQGEADPYCTQPSTQNEGRYVWVDCMDGGHLIDLVTFHSQAYPPPVDGPYGGGYYNTRDTKWSADGNFVWFNEKGAKSILSGATGEMKPLPRDCYGFEWHPKDNALLCRSDDDQKLLLLDARTLSVKKEFTLPAKFGEFTWDTDGKHIELVASDKSVWRLDYPHLDDFEQLTPPLSQLVGQNGSISFDSNLVWSPDRRAIAFISAQDIYVVQIDSKP